MKKIYRISLILFACLGISLACTKIETGYLSDYIKYSNPLMIIQAGSYSLTQPLFIDGSTVPLEVEVTEIRNKNTGAVAADLLEERELNMWKKPYNYLEDTTEALVLEKLELKAVPAFEVNHRSGVVRFNPNTAFAEDTLYEFDLKISNVRDTKEYPSIGQVKFVPIQPVEYRTGARVRIVSNDGNGTVYQYVENVQNHIDGTSDIVTVTKVSEESAPGVTVHLKAVDKNGDPFNWETGEVQENWPGYNLPGYESAGSSIRTVRTASEISYYFPVTPFPYASWYSKWYMYYQILPPAIGSIEPDDSFSDKYTATDSHWANFRLNLQIFEAGTWEIVVHFNYIVRS